MNDQESALEETVQTLYDLTIEYINNGASGQQLESVLVENGLHQEVASSISLLIITHNIVNPSKDIEDTFDIKKVLRMHIQNPPRFHLSSIFMHTDGLWNMLFGLLWCVFGIIITAITYSAASAGGRYIVAYGAIIIGALQFLVGLMQYIIDIIKAIVKSRR